jgi:hypothetical protein
VTDYGVYATRWDDPHIVEELVPARGLSFGMPLSDHGEASFTATVEPGRSSWRAALGLPLSGILVTADGHPCWSGWVTGERQTGQRTFAFTAVEWGAIFARFPAPTKDYLLTDGMAAMRDLIASAQAVAGQNVAVAAAGTGTSGYPAGVQVNAWDTSSVEDVLRQITEAENGPEWYFATTGTLDNPQRTLIHGVNLGNHAPDDDPVLHYVESTPDWAGYPAPGGVRLLTDLFPGEAANVVQDLPRRGGNVLAVSRDRSVARSATQIIGTGDGAEIAQLRRFAVNTRLRNIGWPLLTSFVNHGGINDEGLLQRLVNADRDAVGGIATSYAISTYDGDPEWSQVPRGSHMRAILDTDVYATPRPYTFRTRLLNTTVAANDDGGPAQITWDLAETLEAS